MSNNKTSMPVDAKSLRVLRDHAKQVGTLDRWSDMACEWAEAAEQHFQHLNDRIKELGG